METTVAFNLCGAISLPFSEMFLSLYCFVRPQNFENLFLLIFICITWHYLRILTDFCTMSVTCGTETGYSFFTKIKVTSISGIMKVKFMKNVFTNTKTNI